MINLLRKHTESSIGQVEEEREKLNLVVDSLGKKSELRTQEDLNMIFDLVKVSFVN
jgi:polyhydroxyalkanoate synthesis regulator phasin